MLINSKCSWDVDYSWKNKRKHDSYSNRSVFMWDVEIQILKLILSLIISVEDLSIIGERSTLFI